MNVQEIQREALERARNGESASNYTMIFAGFEEKGIPAEQIRPRENVFTYHAWRAIGRQVRKGEHGVKIVTYVPMTKKVSGNGDGEEERVSFRRPRSVTVFHISQTDPVD